MGIFDFVGDLFEPQGGGTEQAPTLSAEQQGFLNQVLGRTQGLIPEGLTPVDFQSAGASGLQQQAFGGLGNLAQQGFGIAGQQLGAFDPSQAQGFLGQAGGALGRGFQGIDTQAISDAFAPSRQLAQGQFEQSTLPNLLERFGASSGGSGALQQQLAQAGGNLSLGLRAQEAPFIGQAALNAPGQQFQGAALAGQLAGVPGQLAGQGVNLGGNVLQQLLGAGGAQRGIEQERIAAQNQSALQPQNLLGQFGQLGLGTPSFENIVTPPGPSIFSQFGQLAAPFISAGF